jgi:2-keto-4-pentenoate hydratase
MRPVPPQLIAALTAQQDERRVTLAAGAEPVGWKVGLSGREGIDGELVIGYLTSATQLEPGSAYCEPGWTLLHADAEVAVRLGADDSIEAWAPAIELVDLAGTDDAQAIVAANVWHRPFALGQPLGSPPAGDLEATLIVNGEKRLTRRSDADLGDRVRTVDRLLDAVGEHLQPGDWIITGNVAQVPVRAGDDVIVDFGQLGRVGLRIAGR